MSEIQGNMTPEKANAILKKYAARLDGAEPETIAEPETALTREQVFELMAYLGEDIKRMQTDISMDEDTLAELDKRNSGPTIH